MTGGYGAKRDRERQMDILNRAGQESSMASLLPNTELAQQQPGGLLGGGLTPAQYRELAVINPQWMSSYNQATQNDFNQNRGLSNVEQFAADERDAREQRRQLEWEASHGLNVEANARNAQSHAMQMAAAQRQQELAEMPPIHSMSPMEILDFEMGLTNNMQRITDARALMDDIRAQGTGRQWGSDFFDRLGESRLSMLQSALIPLIEEEMGRPMRREEMQHILAPLETAATWSTAQGAENALNVVESILNRAEQRLGMQYEHNTWMQLPDRSEWGVAPSFAPTVPPAPPGIPRSVQEQPAEQPRSRGQGNRNR